MSFNLLVSDVYKLIVGDGYHLAISGESNSKARRWNGTSWVAINSLSHFNGTAMVSTSNVKFYNGSAWENLF